MARPQLFAAHQITALRSQFANIKTVNPDMLPRFHKLFEGMTDAQINQIAGAKIAFLSSLAGNEAIRRGLFTDYERAMDAYLTTKGTLTTVIPNKLWKVRTY